MKPIKTRLGKLHVWSGTRTKRQGGLPICPACRDKVKDGDKFIVIDRFGETPRWFHAQCMGKLIHDLFIYHGAGSIRGKDIEATPQGAFWDYGNEEDQATRERFEYPWGKGGVE